MTKTPKNIPLDYDYFNGKEFARIVLNAKLKQMRHLAKATFIPDEELANFIFCPENLYEKIKKITEVKYTKDKRGRKRISKRLKRTKCYNLVKKMHENE